MKFLTQTSLMKKIKYLINNLLINSTFILLIFLTIREMQIIRNIPLDTRLYLYFYSITLTLKFGWIMWVFRLDTIKIKNYFIDNFLKLSGPMNYLGEKFKEYLKVKWIAWGVIPLILIVFGLFMSLMNLVSLDESFTLLSDKEPEITYFNYMKEGMISGDKSVFKFKASENNLGIVSLRINTFDRINSDQLVFRIKKENQQDWYYENTYFADQFVNEELFLFGFPIYADSKEEIFIIEIESLLGEKENSIAISEIEPNIIPKYKYNKKELVENKSKLIDLFIKKIRYNSFSVFSLIISLFYFIPLVVYFSILKSTKGFKNKITSQQLFSSMLLLYLSFQFLEQIYKLMAKYYFKNVILAKYFSSISNTVLCVVIFLGILILFNKKSGNLDSPDS